MKSNYYLLAFKKPKSGRLIWLAIKTKSEREAKDRGMLYMADSYGGKGYRLYAGPLLHNKEQFVTVKHILN